MVSAGGRVLSVTATGDDLAQTRERAYAAVGRIHLDGSHHRTDIAAKAAELQELAAGFIGLAISHGVSFWMNYLGRGEYRALSPAQLMTQPYGRLVIMHVTIIIGAFVSGFLGTPLGSLLVLVVLKTALDLYFHLRQHRTDAALAGEGIAT